MQAKSLFLTLTLFLSISIQAQWEELNDFPFPGRHHGIGFSIDGSGYVITGSANDMTKDVFKYDPDTDGWEELSEYPGPARGFSIGDVWNDKAYFGFGISPFGLLNDLWEFDAATGQFTELASCPCDERTHPAFVAINDKVFMGLGADSGGNLGDWWEYDIATDTWTEKETFPGANRHHPYQFVLSGYVYVGSGHQEDWYRYDPGNDSWIQLADHPSYTRVAGAQFAYNGKGYTLSGVGHLNNGTHEPFPTGEFWEYDPLLDTWTELPSHDGISRWAPASFIIDGYVYLISGDNFSERSMDRYFLGEPATSVSEEKKVDLTIFPQPSNDHVTISTSENIIGAYAQIVNLSGQVVYEGRLNSNRLDISALTTGIYQLSITADDWTAVSSLIKD